MAEKGCICLGCIIAGIALLLAVILIPLSFAGLEYYEMGFVQSKSSGTVDTRTVYMGGLHFIGVNSKFKKFPSSTHNLQLTRATVFNKEKLQISLSGLIGYTLRPEDLKLLHDKYNLGYEPIIQNTVLAAIKTAATAFTVDEYRRNRAKVSKGLFDAVHEALGGKCCRKDCNKYRCQQNCKRYNLCRDSDKGHFADVSYLYLQMVDLSYAQEQRYLRQVIEKEKQDTEKFKQQEKVVRKKTQQNRKEKENQASEVLANAKAKAYILTANARANAKSVTEDARNSGLQILYSK